MFEIKNDLTLLSVVIPARNEQDAIPGTVEQNNSLTIQTKTKS